MKTIAVSELKKFVVAIFEQCGVSAEDAALAAEALVTTDSWGVQTHGTKAAGSYARRLRTGGLNPKGRPKILREGPAWAVVDADRALAMVGGVFAMKTAMAKARASGIALVTVRDSCHFGAAGYYTHVAAQENLIGFAMSNDIPAVAAHGTKGPIFGSNPFAFGAPGASHPDVNLDISTAVAAGGKIRLLMAEGKPIPQGWLVDQEGRPTTDGNVYGNGGALLPMAGHKGYGLAMMIDILAGILSGASVRGKVGGWLVPPLSKPTDHGQAFIAIDPKVFVGSDAYNAGIDSLIGGIKKEPFVEGGRPLFMPGEIEHDKRVRALKEGIPLGDDVVDSLKSAAIEASLPLPPCLA